MTVYTDTFNRPNSGTVNVPNSGTLGSIPGGGPTWQVSANGWGIIDGKARSLGGQVANYDAWAVVDVGSSDVDVNVDVSNQGGDALMFRFVNSTNWHRVWLNSWNNGGARVWRVVYETMANGSRQIIANVGVPFATNHLRVRAVGSLIQVYSRNSPTQAWYLRASSTQTVHISAEKHGIGRAKERALPGAYSGTALDNFTVDTLNSPPNAPTLVSPGNNAQVNVEQLQRFDWSFNDPDAGDSQSRYQLQYWRSGVPAVTLDGYTSNTYRDVSAGTFTAHTWQWRVRTWDSHGYLGPWSSTRTFQGIAAPDGPGITSPSNNATITSQQAILTWTASEQHRYQIQMLGDSGGSMDTSTVLFDITVADQNTRSRVLSFTNDMYVWIRVRIEVNGLWGPWTAIRVLVSFTPPASPDLSVEIVDGTALISPSFPTPGAGVPAAVSYDVHRRTKDEPGEYGGIRIAAGVNASRPYVDPHVWHRQQFEWLIVANAATGATSPSGWVSG